MLPASCWGQASPAFSEESDFTSIQARIVAVAQQAVSTSPADTATLKLLPFAGHGQRSPSLPLTLKDYLLLVDGTGRHVRKGKRGHIDGAQPPILERLEIDRNAWQMMMRPSSNRFGRAIGSLERMRQHAKTIGHPGFVD